VRHTCYVHIPAQQHAATMSQSAATMNTPQLHTSTPNHAHNTHPCGKAAVKMDECTRTAHNHKQIHGQGPRPVWPDHIHSQLYT
jgi:hypothetical protein